MVKTYNKCFIIFSLILLVLGIVMIQKIKPAPDRRGPKVLGVQNDSLLQADDALAEDPLLTDFPADPALDPTLDPTLMDPLLMGPDALLMQEEEMPDIAEDDFLKLFFNKDFLNLQESIIQESLPKITFQKEAIVAGALTPPVGVQVWDNKNGQIVTIVWDKFLTPPAKVRILRSLSEGGESEVLAEVDGKDFGFHDNQVEIGQKYYYSLLSIAKDKKESEITGPYKVGPIEDLTPPDSPKEVKVVVEDGKVTISWQDPEDSDLANINIYRSVEKGELGEQIAKIEPGLESFVDQEPLLGILYYLVLATDTSGNQSVYGLLDSQIGNPNPFSASF